MASYRFCDKIAVFENGRIIQFGTHTELSTDKEGKYYKLWIAQAKYYSGLV